MARGTWKMLFRILIRKASDTGSDTAVFEAGEYASGAPLDPQDNGGAKFGNLNAAVTACLAIMRRYDSLGTDVKGYVMGQPFGENATPQPRLALNGDVAGGGGTGDYPDVTDEDTYAELDVVPRYLKQRIAAANTEAVTGFNLNPADQESEISSATA